jgi:hypothetical protein
MLCCVFSVQDANRACPSGMGATNLADAWHLARTFRLYTCRCVFVKRAASTQSCKTLTPLPFLFFLLVFVEAISLVGSRLESASQHEGKQSEACAGGQFQTHAIDLVS